MGGAVSAGEDNEELVDNLVEAEYVKTSVVEKALRAVDRGNYYLNEFRDNAYKDLAWKHGNLHLSAPCIYSEVLECLHLQPGMSFLNLGSGTGYLSTIAGLLLGSYGVNHGVEMHADVVDYCRKKLDEFMKESPAIDLMEFCPPKFVVGNCLQLEPESSMASYDRVYCGAAVPQEHISYVKSLVKIGGVVVMPCEDQLLQIKRTGENSWDQNRVLPVSFASLIVPTRDESKSCGSVRLPSREPLSLLEICRSATRALIRKSTVDSNPDFEMRSLLTLKNKNAPRSASEGNDVSPNNHSSLSSSRRRQRRLRRIVIPVFQQESDEEEDENPQPAQGNERLQRLRRQVIAFGAAEVYRNRDGQVQMEGLRWNRLYVGERSGSNNGHDAVEAASTEAAASSSVVEKIDEEEGEKTDSNDFIEEDLRDGLPADLNNEDEDSAVDLGDDDNSLANEQLPPVENQEEAHSNKDDNHSSNNGDENNEETKIDGALPIEFDEAAAATASIDGSKRSRSESDAHERQTRRKRAAAAFKRSNADESSDEDDEGDDAYKELQRGLRARNMRMQLNFSEQVKRAIFVLPLPESLKSYLNYYRN